MGWPHLHVKLLYVCLDRLIKLLLCTAGRRGQCQGSPRSAWQRAGREAHAWDSFGGILDQVFKLSFGSSGLLQREAAGLASAFELKPTGVKEEGMGDGTRTVTD